MEVNTFEQLKEWLYMVELKPPLNEYQVEAHARCLKIEGLKPWQVIGRAYTLWCFCHEHGDDVIDFFGIREEVGFD